jgi:3',5'-nucleoside bisphosphate phosphatase
MPSRQPFTALCRTLAQNRSAGWFDLHIHSTASDGSYTPEQVVNLARRSGLAGLALTDHDTLDGIPAALTAAGGAIEVIPGVEITAEYEGRELHLLGYFVDLADRGLQTALARLRDHRVGRFWEMVERLCACGVTLDRDDLARHAGTGVLGRRRLAEYLMQSAIVTTVREAFQRYLGDKARACVPKLCLPVAEALALVHGAGGVAAWAHPSHDCTREKVDSLKGLGLSALEVHYPSFRPTRVRELQTLADAFGLAATGGSDCHGPARPGRAIGVCGVSREELERLRWHRNSALAFPRALN